MNMALFFTAVVSGGMLLWPVIQRLIGASAPQVAAAQAVQLVNRRDALFIDTRDKSAYDAGHVPNARHIPHSELERRASEIEKNKSRPLILVCPPSAPAAALCKMLKQRGFEEVVVLRDGVRGWLDATLPLEKHKAEKSAKTEKRK